MRTMTVPTTFRFTLVASLVAIMVAANVQAEVRKYDTHGRLTSVVYDTGFRVTYTYDQNGNVLTSSAQDDPLAEGDIDGSGGVDAVDVQLTINAALSLEVPYPSDQDGNGETDAVDVQRVINAALGL